MAAHLGSAVRARVLSRLSSVQPASSSGWMPAANQILSCRAASAAARQLLASCRRELRDCLWDLRSRTFDEKDMTEAIERTLEPHSVSAKISVRFNVPRESLSDSTTHAILHIVRELVVNAIRHGKATEIKVAGESHEGTISFSVKDNGCGFDPSAAPGPNEGHFGLLGIRERLKALHGTFTVESALGKGAKFKVTILNPEK